MAKDDANQVKPADSADKHELWDRLESLRTVMLTTHDAEGRMGSRPVTVLKIDDGRMWFFARSRAVSRTTSSVTRKST